MPTVKDIVVRKPTKQEAQKCKSWSIWTCQESAFDWDYTQKETCLIIEGRVTVKDRPGESLVSFGPGDLVVFPQDLSCTWQVKEPVRKYYKFD
jgi:hypothetical protein